LAGAHSSAHTFARQVGDVSHRAPVGVAIRCEVSKTRNARDESAIALAIDHCPVPDFVHALPLYAQDITKGVQPGKMKTDRAVAAMEARATTANRTIPARASC
jgi:hypothetical protein